MKDNNFFSSDSPLSRLVRNYKVRDAQIEVFEKIDKAIREKRNLVIEAGTGSGKSIAYLASVFLNESSGNVVIATPTINLQKQLYYRDLEIVKRATKTEKKTALLYGRVNYLCLLKINQMILNDKEKKIIEKSKTGSVPSLPLNFSSSSFVSDNNECLKRDCPFYEDCYYYRARKKALTADVVIVNYRLLFIDAALREEENISFSDSAILPGYKILILDEAHKTEDEVREVFSQVYQTQSLERCYSLLSEKNKNLSGQSVLDVLKEKYLIDTDKIKGEISDIILLANNFASFLSSIFLLKKTEEAQILLDEEEAISLKEGFKEAFEIKKRCERVESVFLSMPDEDDLSVKILKNILSNISLSTEALFNFSSFSSFEKNMYVVRKEGDNFSLSLSPLLTGEIISSTLFSNLDSVVCTSATLSVGNDFSHFSNSLNLSPEKTDFTVVRGGFDYEKQLLLLIPTDGEIYKQENDKKYGEYLASSIKKCIKSSKGGALVLFTSKKLMHFVYNILKDDIENLYIQKERGSSVLDEFRNNEESSLFALSSFWEGVDTPGDSLRLVIITKLPFANIKDPVTIAKERKAEREGMSGFYNISLPLAILKLRQGIGRLIRGEDDRGVVVILDSRIYKKSYGEKIIKSISPESKPKSVSMDDIPSCIEGFLYKL